MRIVYSCTAGTIGVGDLVHGLALRNAAARSGLPITVSLIIGVAPSSPSPRSTFPAFAQIDDLTLVPIDPAVLVDDARAPSSPLAAAVVAARADVVVVGQFWMPLQAIVRALGLEAWLLVRKAPAAWMQGSASAPFSPSTWRRIFEIEPVGFAGGFESLEPLVICNGDDLLPADVARARLLDGVVDDGRPLRLICQAGRAGETTALALSSSSSSSMQTRVIDLRDARAPFPIAPLLAGADEVVTGAGYNAWWEAQWLGTAHKTRFVPFARTIDDQAWRCALTSPPRHNGADQLIEQLWRRHMGGV